MWILFRYGDCAANQILSLYLQAKPGYYTSPYFEIKRETSAYSILTLIPLRHIASAETDAVVSVWVPAGPEKSANRQ
jgi:hypothetical protein